MKILATENQYFRVGGRSLVVNDERYLTWSGTFVEFTFTGTKVSAVIKSVGFADCEDLHAWMGVYLDGSEEPYKRFKLDPDATKEYVLYEEATEQTHVLRLVRMSEAAFAKAAVISFDVDCKEGDAPTPTTALSRRIEFIGDSITCGYGNEGVLDVDVFRTSQENPIKAYAVQTARRLMAEYHLVSWSGIGVISGYIDASVDEPFQEWLMPMIYPYTDPAISNDHGLEKKDWERYDANEFMPDVVVLNLGTNDRSYTRFMEDRTREFERLYYEFLVAIRAKNPKSEIVCTLGVMEPELIPAVDRVVKRFAIDNNDTKISFLPLEVQSKEDGLGADSHPSLITHQKLADKLTAYIKTRMGW